VGDILASPRQRSDLKWQARIGETSPASLGSGKSLDRPQTKSLKQRTLSAYGNFVAAAVPVPLSGWKTCSPRPLPIASFACKAPKVYAKLLPFSMDSFRLSFCFWLNFNSCRKYGNVADSQYRTAPMSLDFMWRVRAQSLEGSPSRPTRPIPICIESWLNTAEDGPNEEFWPTRSCVNKASLTSTSQELFIEHSTQCSTEPISSLDGEAS